MRRCQYSQRIPVKVGVDSSHIGSVACDVHAATLVGCVEGHVNSVEQQIPNGEHIICNIEGCSVLNADTGLDGVDGAAKLASTIGLQRQKMNGHVPGQRAACPSAVPMTPSKHMITQFHVRFGVVRELICP